MMKLFSGTCTVSLLNFSWISNGKPHRHDPSKYACNWGGCEGCGFGFR